LSSGEKADDFSLSSFFSRAVSRAYFVNKSEKKERERTLVVIRGRFKDRARVFRKKLFSLFTRLVVVIIIRLLRGNDDENARKM